ncbi:MAG: tRNA preQ1(34) S-adenosylmethionine ribosyltransferase-isomerase QueA [Enterobacter hormaechei]
MLVFNNTRDPARVSKASGGRLRCWSNVCSMINVFWHIFAHPKAPKPGAELLGDDECSESDDRASRRAVRVEFNDERTCLISSTPSATCRCRRTLNARMKKPTASCIRPSTARAGAVAAPTAGLHFDEPLLEKLRAKGIEMAFVTLHVGAGTFQPVRVDSIEDHIMHSEYAEVPQEVVDAVLAAKARGNRVVAVGTTSVRSLESAAQAAKSELIEPFFGDTQIFIYPGYQYKVIDALVTNFHLPESTLIMLVSAFAGYQHTMNAYKSAVEQKYRFFSYGDAMFITYNPQALNERVGE